MNEFVIDRGSEMSLNQLGLTIDGIEVCHRGVQNNVVTVICSPSAHGVCGV